VNYTYTTRVFVLEQVTATLKAVIPVLKLESILKLFLGEIEMDT